MSLKYLLGNFHVMILEKNFPKPVFVYDAESLKSNSKCAHNTGDF